MGAHPTLPEWNPNRSRFASLQLIFFNAPEMSTLFNTAAHEMVALKPRPSVTARFRISASKCKGLGQGIKTAPEWGQWRGCTNPRPALSFSAVLWQQGKAEAPV